MKTTGTTLKWIVVCVFTFAGVMSGIAIHTTEEINITTPSATVDFETNSINISGTSENLTSAISWENQTTGVTGSIPHSLSWTITGIPLALGENTIKVSGWGNYSTVSDEVLITRNHYSSTTRFVSPTSPIDGPGTVWSNAFHTIQAAVDAASDNYMIIVSNGVYETGGAPASASKPLTNRVCVTKPLTIKSLNGPSKTIIVGDGNQSAIDLDAAESNYVSIASSEALNLTNNYTIEAWIYPRSFNWLGGIVSKYQTAGSGGYLLRLSGDAPHQGINFDELSTTNNMVLSSNQWYHIAAVNDNGTRHLYINGIEEALSTNTPLTVTTNSDPILIGCDYSEHPRFFNGLIDEVRIWNVARTQSEIQQYMNKNVSRKNSHLVGRWKLDENNGNLAADSSLLENNGTLENGASWKTSDLVDMGTARCVRLIKNSTLNGFTLKNGSTLSSGDQNINQGGGGALLDHGGTLTNCIVSGNRCNKQGAGVNLHHGGTVINCTIENNTATKNGGGILNEEGIVTDSTITNNTAKETGGGLYCFSTNTKIKDCTITENSAKFGGGIYKGSLSHCVVTHNSVKENGGGCHQSRLIDCEIAHNIALYGGGVYESSLTRCIIRNNKARTGAYGGGSAYSTLENCKIFDNNAGNGGGGTFYCSLTHCIVRNNSGYQHGGGSFRGTLKNCIVVNNSSHFTGPNIYNASVTNSCSPDLTDGVDGNITNAPLFIDADANNFHLQTNSPCIDTGLNGLLASDFEGTPRPLDSDNNGTAIADMGCYELMNNAADSDGDSASDGDEIIADTNPADSNSWFHITSATNNGTFEIIEFESSSKRRYYILTSTNLLKNSWEELPGTSKIGIDGLDLIKITNAPPIRYYKLYVEQN